MTDSLTFYAVAEAATNQGGLYRSTDQGASWQPVTTTGLDGNLWSIFVAPSNANRLYAGVTIANAHDTSYQDFIYRSDDAGATWTRVWRAMPDAYLWDLVIDPANSARIVAATKTNGTEATGVYLSSDAGASWSGLDEGLDDRSIDDLALDPLNPGILYASTPSGVFRADLADPPAGNRWAIEYHHSRFDHYFVTADPDEIAALDAGAFEGWARTHATFRVAPATPPESPTCRFFGVGFGPLSSHFYTPYPDECATVKLDPKWVYEKLAFGLRLPNAQSGCVPGTVPLYRAWNRNRDGAPNHRYAMDWPTFKAMLADGWQFEGELSTKVFACVPL
jgi:hypothetical protein